MLSSLKKSAYALLSSVFVLSACSSLRPGVNVLPAQNPLLRAANASTSASPGTDLKNPGRIWQDEIIYFIF